jgi:hypothetical protein
MNISAKDISKEEIEEMRKWLKEQSTLVNITSEDYIRLILYKLYEFEERLKIIEYNQQTHWVR